MTSGAGPAEYPKGRPKSLWKSCPINTSQGPHCRQHTQKTPAKWFRPKSSNWSYIRDAPQKHGNIEWDPPCPDFWADQVGTILSMEGVGPFQKGVYDFLRKVPQIGEVKLVTYFYSSCERGDQDSSFWRRWEPFHDRQGATSFPDPLPQYSKHSSLPIFPREAEISCLRWKNTAESIKRTLYIVFTQ